MQRSAKGDDAEQKARYDADESLIEAKIDEGLPGRNMVTTDFLRGKAGQQIGRLIFAVSADEAGAVVEVGAPSHLVHAADRNVAFGGAEQGVMHGRTYDMVAQAVIH